jgi:hypothetical protein
MVWFLLAPLAAAYGAKKLYDALTEPDQPSTPPPRSALSLAKDERTRVRKEAIKDGFLAQCKRVGMGIGQARLASGLGPVALDTETPGLIKADFEGYGRALATLNHARQCLDGGRFDTEPGLCLELKVPTLEDWYATLLGKAEADYGGMAGITASHAYDREQDPFLAALRSV